MLRVLSWNRWRLISLCLYVFCCDTFASDSPQVPSVSFSPSYLTLSLFQSTKPCLSKPTSRVEYNNFVVLTQLCSLWREGEFDCKERVEFTLLCAFKMFNHRPWFRAQWSLKGGFFIYLYVCLFKVLNAQIKIPILCGFTWEDACGNSAAPEDLLCLWSTAPTEPWKNKRNWYLQIYNEFHLRKIFSRTIKKTLQMLTSKGH